MYWRGHLGISHGAVILYLRGLVSDAAVTEAVVNSYLSHGEQAKTSIKGFCRADNWFGCLSKACWVQRKGVGWVAVLGTLSREKRVWCGGATQLRLLAAPLSKQMAQKVFSHWVIVVGYLGGHSIPQGMYPVGFQLVRLGSGSEQRLWGALVVIGHC